MAKQFPIHAARPVPDVLYRYMPWNENTKSILLNEELWFSSPNDFNDPYEFRCLITLPESESERNSLLTRTCDVHFPADTEIERKTRIQRFREEISYYNGIVPLIDKKMREGFAVCCMSEIPDNLLMWSHYAKFHEGVCVGVSTKELSQYCSIAEVEYTETLLRVPCNDCLFSLPAELIHKAVRTKSVHWSYEREWRLVRVGVEPGLMKLPTNSIVSLTIGCRADESTCLEILKTLDCLNRVIDLNIARDNREHYHLDIVRLNGIG